MFLKEEKQDMCSVNSCIFWFRSVMSLSLYIWGVFVFFHLPSVFSLNFLCFSFYTVLKVASPLQLAQKSGCAVRPWTSQPAVPAAHSPSLPLSSPCPLAVTGLFSVSLSWLLFCYLVFNGKEIILSMRVLVFKGGPRTFAWKMDTVGPA